MRRRRAAWVVGASLAGAVAIGCVVVTGSTDGYQLVDAGAAACADGQVARPNVPDATIGDTGATTGACIACIERACSKEEAACQEDCACRTLALDYFACIAGGASASKCSDDAFGAASLAVLQLGACVRQSGCEVSACGGRDGG